MNKLNENGTTKEIKKVSAQWIKEVDYEVLDPDGWDRTNFNYSWNEEKITIVEFQRRLMLSTIKRKFGDSWGCR